MGEDQKKKKKKKVEGRLQIENWSINEKKKDKNQKKIKKRSKVDY